MSREITYFGLKIVRENYLVLKWVSISIGRLHNPTENIKEYLLLEDDP